MAEQDIEKVHEQSGRITQIINTLAHPPSAALHHAELADELISKLAADYHDDNLEPSVREWWEANYMTAREARDALREFADTYNAEHPIYTARPVE